MISDGYKGENIVFNAYVSLIYSKTNKIEKGENICKRQTKLADCLIVINQNIASSQMLEKWRKKLLDNIAYKRKKIDNNYSPLYRGLKM